MPRAEFLAALLEWFDVLSVDEVDAFMAVGPFFSIRPNPVQTELIIRLNSAVIGLTGSVTVYDATGRLVCTIADGRLDDELIWDLYDTHDRRIPTGIYFVHLDLGVRTETVKTVVIR
jgi:hypothetical protein